MKTLIAIGTLVSALVVAPQANAGEGGSCHFHGTNPAAADKAMQTLFVFFAHNGNFIAANFTGQ